MVKFGPLRLHMERRRSTFLKIVAKGRGSCARKHKARIRAEKYHKKMREVSQLNDRFQPVFLSNRHSFSSWFSSSTGDITDLHPICSLSCVSFFCGASLNPLSPFRVCRFLRYHSAGYFLSLPLSLMCLLTLPSWLEAYHVRPPLFKVM